MTDDPWAEQAPTDEPGGLAEPGDDTFSKGALGDSASAPRFADIAKLSYEDARDQLVAVVQRLESGQAPLDETMSLWERGEALTDHCSAWLDRAEKRLDEAIARRG